MNPSFRLRSLLIAVAVIALACGSIVSPGSWCGWLLDAAVWLALAVAIIAAIFGRDSIRAFCAGFAIVGGLYFAWAFVPMFRELPGPQAIVGEMARVVHKLAVPMYVARYTEPGFQATAQPGSDNTVWLTGPNSIYSAWTGLDWQCTQRAADCLATLVIGCLGGIVARRIRQRPTD